MATLSCAFVLSGLAWNEHDNYDDSCLNPIKELEYKKKNGYKKEFTNFGTEKESFNVRGQDFVSSESIKFKYIYDFI